MTTSKYCLYVGFDYTYIDINALAQYACMYACMYVCMYIYIYVYMYYVCMLFIYLFTYLLIIPSCLFNSLGGLPPLI